MKLISSTYEIDIPMYEVSGQQCADITNLRVNGLISAFMAGNNKLHVTVATPSVLEDICEILGLDCNGGKGE